MVEEKLAKSDRILEEMVSRLIAAFNPDHIYLYGSRARGEAGPDSDYNLLLVVSASQVPCYRRDQQAFRALCGLGVSKGVIVLTRAEFFLYENAGSAYGFMVQGLGGLITYLLLAIYCHKHFQERVSIKSVRELRISIQNEARILDNAPRTLPAENLCPCKNLTGHCWGQGGFFIAGGWQISAIPV